MKCVLCRARKGKRFCPAKQALICAPCCGEKRVVEIACPPDCVYLTTGQGYESSRKFRNQFTREGGLERELLAKVHLRLPELLGALEALVLRFAATLSTLKDEQVLEALSLVRATLQTEQKGILYEHRSTDPIAQSLARTLLEAVQDMREGEEDTPTLGDLIDCLKVMEMDVRFHVQGSGKEQDYLRFIRRNHPEVRDRPSGGLIIPGR